jgi:hypothetical protein
MTISCLEQMKVIPDHRITGIVTYPLDEILLATLVGVLCGADDREAIERLSREYLGWLKQLLPYKTGIPHAQTFRKVFRLPTPGSPQPWPSPPGLGSRFGLRTPNVRANINYYKFGDCVHRVGGREQKRQDNAAKIAARTTAASLS